MTVQYSSDVFTSTGTYGLFLRLLRRWRGSIYKLIWYDLLVYVALYYLISCLYRFGLDDAQKTVFENISLYCSSFADLIPITFVLGFYVSLVIQRWWSQFNLLPWPDSASVWISTCIHGHDERGRLMRRTIVRYLNLTLILTLRLISLPVKKRFPSLDHLVEAGILLEGEKKIFEKMDSLSLSHPKYWMPLIWAGSIVTRARKEGRVKDDFALKTLIQKIDEYRTFNGGLLNYDWVNIPLVYTQVVTLAVYTFLLSTLMGRQFLDPSKNYKGHEVDLYVPVFTFLQFFFYMGWLKVAEALINPFGEDDDDFDVNWLIDRNLQVSYLIVDEMHLEHPELIRDQFWDEAFPELPYTAAAEETRVDPIFGAAACYEVEDNEAEFLPMDDATLVDVKEVVDDDDDDDHDHDRVSLISTSRIRLKSPIGSPKGEDGGIIVNIPASSDLRKIDIEAGGDALKKGMKKNHSNASFRSSNTSIEKGSSRRSFTSNPINMLMGSRVGSAMGDFKSMMGSQTSLFSKRTSKLYGRRRRNLRRTSSRLSNNSTESQALSPKVKVERGFLHGKRAKDDEEMIGSDNTSLNSTIDVDMNSVCNSRISRADMLNRSKALGSIQDPMNPAHHMKLSADEDIRRGMTVPSSTPGVSRLNDPVHLQNRLLREKLEVIQSIHDDILHQLDREIMEHEQSLMDENAPPHHHHHAAFEDATDLVHSLEERTELLKLQLKRRRNRSKTSRRSSCSSPGPSSSSQKFFPNAMEPAEINQPEMKSISAEVQHHHHHQASHGQGESDTGPTLSTQSSAGKSSDTFTTVQTVAEHDKTDPALITNDLSNVDADNEEENVDNNDTDDNGSSSNSDNSNSGDEPKSPAEDSIGDMSIQEVSEIQDGYENELSTIEETPELGYQSDSSETESQVPKVSSENRKNVTHVSSLPTLQEEDDNQANSSDSVSDEKQDDNLNNH